MAKSNFVTTLSNEARLNKIYVYIILGLISLIVFIGISILNNSNKQSVILVPYSALSVKHDIKISGILDEDIEYLRHVLDSDLMFIANYNPLTIDRNISILTLRLSGSARSSFLEDMKDQVEFIKKNSISQTFIPEDIKYLSSKKLFKVTGTLLRYSGDSVLSRVRYSYMIKYKMALPMKYIITGILAGSNISSPTPKSNKQ